MGIPTDVARASAQGLARIWSRALWSHDANPDDLMYDPRLNGETNVVVFDRAIPKLVAVATPRLVDCHGDLATILTDLDLAIVLTAGSVTYRLEPTPHDQKPSKVVQPVSEPSRNGAL